MRSERIQHKVSRLYILDEEQYLDQNDDPDIHLNFMGTHTSGQLSHVLFICHLHMDFRAAKMSINSVKIPF